MKIRSTVSADIPFLAGIIDATELFPSEKLPDMVDGFITNPCPNEIWLTCEFNGTVVGFCYAVPEKLTDGTWNMLSIAVHPSYQGKGVGTSIIRRFEDTLRERGNRIVIVDTSGAPEFAQTRQFYLRNGYFEEARIRDFWSAGNDKIVFWKDLN